MLIITLLIVMVGGFFVFICYDQLSKAQVITKIFTSNKDKATKIEQSEIVNKTDNNKNANLENNTDKNADFKKEN